ncbi:MAG: nuclear transport factor 2 family protein [Planctomycetota bacterium]
MITLSTPNPATATPAAPTDEAAVATVVEAVGVLADLGDFTALEKLYAHEVEVDYTSLNGGEPETMSPRALMTRWAGVLPGFDRTRHALSEVEARVDGDTATAAARVTADHWIGEQHWRVAGRYDYRLSRTTEGWQITHMTFILEDETGSREVFGPAIEAAEAEPNAYLVRQRSRQTVLDFLEGLETKDMDRVNGVWAEDAVQEMPYSPPGHPKRVAGRANLVALYADWPKNTGDANFTDELVFYPTLDPNVVFAEFRGVTHVTLTDRVYDQRYGGLFHVEAGKIKLFREYYDPARFAEAFGL